MIRYLRRNKEATPSQIASELGISLPTIVRVLGDLSKEGFVEYFGHNESSGGRPAARVRFAGEAHAVVAIQTSRDEIYGTVSDLNGKILIERWAVPSKDGEENVRIIADMIEEMRSKPFEGICSYRGIGVGVPSMVRQPEGLVIRSMGLGWSAMPLRQRLEERLSDLVYVENRNFLGVVGDWAFGAGLQVDNLVRLTIGPGISAGILIGGELYRGSTNSAGELAWFLDDPRLGGHHLPLLGDRDSLRFERGIPEDAFVALEAVAEAHRAGTLDLDMLEGDAASSGELELARELLDYITAAVTTIAALINPSTIVIAGDIVRAGAFVIEVLSRRIGGDVYDIPNIVVSPLGHRAMLMGTIEKVLDTTTLRI